MILGILNKTGEGAEPLAELRRLAERLAGHDRPIQHFSTPQLAMCSIGTGIPSLDEGPQPFYGESRNLAAVFEGKIYNAGELRDELASDHRFATECSGETLVHSYEKHGERFPESVNGKFAVALWDAANRRLSLARDRLGIEPLFYHDDGKRMSFSSSLRALLGLEWVAGELDHDALLQYLLYDFNPGEATLVRGIRRVPAGHVLSVDSSGLRLQQYWQLRFADTVERSEEDLCDEIIELIQDAIRIRCEPDRPPAVFLSGGTDSSGILSMASRLWDEPIPSFSFRCGGRSYDESSYARFVAAEYGATHTEISYGPDEASLISDAVEAMDEPFSDLGIEIGTYLLGRAAAGSASYAFSGEGGDELFGGHPAYSADKVARVADALPRALVAPMARALQAIPDSAEKNTFSVKLKRLAYGLSIPPELLSRRWVTYYTAAELRELCAPDLAGRCDFDGIYAPVSRHAADADGTDSLSRSLYMDYQTLVPFYLRRLRLPRIFGIENRLPLMDHRLVEYAASVPSRLKLRGLSDTKFIYRKALEKVLPRKILYDRPKLGHSVPMKNWLREDAVLGGWMKDLLSDDSVRSRGLFSPPVVRRLIKEHESGRHNHSHRLWGLSVLELWLRHALDG